jgi:L-arabinose isomerase
LADRPKVGVVSVYFTLFDEQMPPDFRQVREEVARGYVDILADHFDIVYTGVLTSDADGDRANELLRRERPDAVVFAPSMAAPPSYAARALAGVEAPVLLWNGPTVRRLKDGLTQAEATVDSAQVACVMLGNVLVREHRPFATVTASPADPTAVARLVRTIRGATAAAALRGATVLRVGDWIPGYLDVESTTTELAQLGACERSIGVDELDAAFAATTSERARLLLRELEASGWEREPGQTDERSARLALALDALVAETGAAALTVNCHSSLLRWNPAIGITACLAASWLTGRGVPVSCTGDLPTALTLLLARTLSGRALYCEFYTPELDTGLMLLAAGGEGDPAWADPAGGVRIEPNVHYPGNSGVGASVSFRLERGPATAMSLSPVGDGWRLAWATGEIVEARYDTMGGPNGMFRFDSGPCDEAGERWIASGATHHNALAYGRLEFELPALASALGIEEVRV